MTKLYFYDHKTVRENVELDSQSDEFKENVVEEDENSEAVVAPKAIKRKVTNAYNSDGSDEEKKKTKRKLHLKMTVMTPSKRVYQNYIKSFPTTIPIVTVRNLLLTLSYLFHV